MKDLVDLIAQIERDEQRPLSELRSRDRDIGKQLSSLKNAPLAQLSAWLDKVNNQDSESLGRKVESAMQFGLVLLLCVGLFLGWLTSKAVFFYNGKTPVNIVDALIILVFFQIIILLFSCLTFLPKNIVRFLPFNSLVNETFSLFNPENLLRVFFRFLPSSDKDPLYSFYGTLKAHRALYSDIEKWNILRASQVFAVFFNLGILISFRLMTISNYHAFGWSTTLGINSSIILKSVTDFLSWPWSWSKLTNAQPSLELIEATLFHIIDDTVVFSPGYSYEILKMWWLFIFLSLLTYGLLPRVLTLAYAHVTFRKLYKHTFLNLPGTRAILDRLNTPLVETASERSEGLMSPVGEGISQSLGGVPKRKSFIIVDWGGTGLSSEKIDSWLKGSIGGTLKSYNKAGGVFTTDHDQKVIESIGLSSSDNSILILVKAYEPPMAEFEDFIKGLRQQFKKERHVEILPVGEDSSTYPSKPEIEKLSIWSNEVKRLGDPWTVIAPIEIYGSDDD